MPTAWCLTANSGIGGDDTTVLTSSGITPMKPVPFIISSVLLVLLLVIATLTTLIIFKLVPHNYVENRCLVCGLHRNDTWTWPVFTRTYQFETNVSKRVQRLNLVPSHTHAFSLTWGRDYGWFGQLAERSHGHSYPEAELMDLSDTNFARAIAALHEVTVRHGGEPINRYWKEIWPLFPPLPTSSQDSSVPTLQTDPSPSP